MSVIELGAVDMDDARRHLRRHYPKCILLERDYGFDMLIPAPWFGGRIDAVQVMVS